MGTFVLYAIEWAILLLALHAIYKLCFAGCTFHRFNRAYLIGSLFVSAAIPLVGINGLLPEMDNMSIENSNLAQALISQNEQTDATMLPGVEVTIHQDLSAIDIIAKTITVIYLIYIITLLTGWTRSFIKMKRFLKNKKSHRLGHMVHIFTHTENFTPFSWINNIVISQDEEAFCQYASLRHELSHVRLMHFADLAILLICTIVNPVCWLVLKEIKIVHEYEADDEVINHYHVVSRDYQKLLIMRTVGAEAYALASSFNFDIKKRIIMMKKQKTTNFRMLWLLAVIPVAGLALTVFAKPVKTDTKVAVEEQQIINSNNVVVKIDKKGQISCSSTRTGQKNISMEELTSTIKSLTTSPDEIVFVIAEESAPKDVFQKVKEQLRTISHLKINYKTFKEEDAQKSEPQEAKETWYPAVEIKKGESSNANSIDELIQKIPGVKIENGNMSINGKDIKRVLVNGKEVFQSASEQLSNNTSNEKQTINKVNNDVINTKVEEQKANPSTESQDNDDNTFMIVEEMPEFPGGMGALLEHIMHNMKYPKSAIDLNIQGRIICQFVVMEDGSLDQFEMVRNMAAVNNDTYSNLAKDENNELTEESIKEKQALFERACAECDAEAIRCLKTMPKWKPGKQRGKNVRVKYTIPVMFRLK